MEDLNSFTVLVIIIGRAKVFIISKNIIKIQNLYSNVHNIVSLGKIKGLTLPKENEMPLKSVFGSIVIPQQFVLLATFNRRNQPES